MKVLKAFQFIMLFAAVALLSFVPIKKKKRSTAKKTPKQELAKPAVKDACGKSYYIIVDKSDYELKVYDDEGWYATYPIVFDSKDLSDKMKEGDKRTPDGEFKVIIKKMHPK